MTERVSHTNRYPGTIRRSVASSVAALGLVAGLTSCGESEPPKLACSVFLLSAMGGNQTAQIIPAEGSAFAEEDFPHTEVKDIVVTFNDKNSDGTSDEQHPELREDFNHQFADYRGITHRIYADVIPVEGSKYDAGHCEAAFEFSNAPVLTF